MKRLFWTLTLLLGVFSVTKAQLVITEIMYNPPEAGTDSLEYVEIYNNGAASVDMTGYSFTQGFVYTFPSFTLNAGEYVVVAKNSAAMLNQFGATAFQWDSGSLSNSGEDIELVDGGGTVVDYVDYEPNNNSNWSNGAHGTGSSFILCDYNGNNSDGTDWIVSTNGLGTIINGNELMASPGAADPTSCVVVPPSYPYYMIEQINSVDANAVGDSLGVTCELRGVAHCFDFNAGTGYTFPLVQYNNVGITIYAGSAVDNYTFTAGDSLVVKGTVTQFRGTLQFEPDTIILASQSNALVNNMPTTVLDEATENKMIVLENMVWADAAATWSGAVNITNLAGTDTFEIFIDSDINLSGLNAPSATDTFSIAGVGAQNDNSSPYDSMYQLKPCAVTDFTLLNTGGNVTPADLVITEIMFNSPESGADSLEFIEIYNNDLVAVDMTGYTFTSGVTYTFPAFTLNPSEYVLVAGDSMALMNQYGVTAFQWTAGDLDDDGEMLVLANDMGATVDSVTYVDELYFLGTAFADADGNGHSLVLCDYNSDNADTTNWNVSAHSTGVSINGIGVFASPAAQDSLCMPAPVDPYPYYSISTINTLDGTGSPDSLGVTCELRGVTYCADFDGNVGYSFGLVEYNNVGITVFSFTDVDGYAFAAGDSLHVRGTVAFFNGLLQLVPDSIAVVSQGNASPMPMVVTDLSENTENKIIRVNGVSLVTPSQWNGNGSSFNVDITNGTDTMTMRVDGDIDLASSTAPVGTFDVIGFGAQFDNSSPYTDGYQIYPCDAASLIGATFPTPTIPYYNIADINGVDSDGNADSLNVLCELRGVVHCMDFTVGVGHRFVILEHNGDGITVYSGGDLPNGFAVTEGDSVHVYGEIGQFSGLLQIYADSAMVISSGNALLSPTYVSDLNESTENKYIILPNVSLVNTAQWDSTGNPAGFDVDITDGTNTFSMRIDDATDLYSQAAPTATNIDIVGFGAQFDNSNPYTTGYQIIPCSAAGITTATGVNTINNDAVINVFPNPTKGLVYVQAETVVQQINVYNSVGALILTHNGNTQIVGLDTRAWAAGMYTVQVLTAEGQQTKRIVVQK